MKVNDFYYMLLEFLFLFIAAFKKIFHQEYNAAFTIQCDGKHNSVAKNPRKSCMDIINKC